MTISDPDSGSGQRPRTGRPPERDKDAKKKAWPDGKYVILAAIIGAAATIGAAVYSSVPTPPPHPTPTPAAMSCPQQMQHWRSTPGRQVFNQFSTMVMPDMHTDASQFNYSALAADLQEGDSIAATMEAYPIPSCMDPQGYWDQMVQQIRRAASEAPGVAARDAAAVNALNAAMIALGHVAVEMNNELRKEKTVGATS